MKISAVISLLLAPSVQGISIESKLKAKFPKMPSGESITNVISNVLEMGKGELSRAMHQEEKYC